MKVMGGQGGGRKWDAYNTGKERDEKLVERGLNTTMEVDYYDRDDGCFYSDEVTFKGLKAEEASSSLGSHRAGKPIPGLYCPNCGAPAITTDQPDIASCTSVLGWFFFYRSHHEEEEEKEEYELKLINGTYQKVKKVKTEKEVKDV